MDNETSINSDKLAFCNFYKMMLVEEISLLDPHLQHYGLCSVIGTTFRNNEGLCSLHNIRVKAFEQDYQITSESTSVVLLETTLKKNIPAYKACEVFGEVVLYDRIDQTCNILPKTVKDLRVHLQLNDNTEPILNAINDRYLPAIQVHHFQIVENPYDLIECNLAIRCLER